MTRYVVTFVALLALTALTFGLSFVHLGAWSTAIAMAIGLAKSALVVLWFMHLLEHRNSARIAFALAVGLALCLVGFTLLDVQTRPRALTPPRAGSTHSP